MILTWEEHQRGFIDFDAVIPEGASVQLWTRTKDDGETDGDWAGPYADPAGSKVLSPPKRYMQLRVNLAVGLDRTKSPELTHVRWDRDGITYVWPGRQGFVGPPTKLSFARDYGCSYRVVVRPKQATWTGPLVIVGRNIRIRLWKAPIAGHRIRGFTTLVVEPDGQRSVQGSVEEAHVEGDTVEVVATINTEDHTQGKDQAKALAESATGLLALSLGEQIIGETVFEDYFFATQELEQGEIHIPVRHLEPLAVDATAARPVDESLVRLQASPVAASLALALRWYAKALGSSSTVDAFVAYFVALETLASGYFAAVDPRPVRPEYVRLREYFEEARPRPDQKLRDTVLARVEDFPLTSKFSAYWTSRFGVETRQSSEFPRLNRLRSELLHGRLQTVPPTQVNQVRELLEKLLGYELGLSDQVSARAGEPRVLGALLRYALVPRGDSPTTASQA